MSRALLLALFVLSLPSTTRAWCRSTTDRTPVAPTSCNALGLPLEWHRRCFTYAIDRRGSVSMPLASIRAVAARSFATWEDVDCAGTSLGFAFMEADELALCQDAEYSSNDGNVNVIAFVDDFEARMLMPSAYAVTIVWHSESTGEIYDADILVNEERGPYGVCPEIGCLDGTVDLENVLTHEAGHFLGLAHSAVLDSTMYYEAPRGQTDKRSLDPDDVAGICAAYPTGSLPDDCSFRPRHGLDVDCENESSGRCSAAAPGATGRPGAAIASLLVGASALVVLGRRRRRMRSAA